MPDTARACGPDIAAICAHYDARPDALIEILLDVQHACGRVTDADCLAIAGILNLSRAEVHGARTFYTDISETPRGRRVIRICRAEACQAVGADRLAEEVEDTLAIAPGETAHDGSVSLETVYCLGNCALGPAVMVDERLIGRADIARLAAVLTEDADG